MDPKIRDSNRKRTLAELQLELAREKVGMGTSRSQRYKQIMALIYYYKNTNRRERYLAEKKRREEEYLLS